MKIRRVIVSDTEQFGGHEKVFIKLTSGNESYNHGSILFINRKNKVFLNALLKAGYRRRNIKLVSYGHKGVKFFVGILLGLFISFFHSGKMCIFIQGGVRSSFSTLLLSGILGRQIISYIPMPSFLSNESFVGRFAYSNVSKIITISSEMKEEFIKRYPNTKVVFVNNPVSEGKNYNLAQLGKPLVCNNWLKIALVGRMDDRQKGFSRLQESFVVLARRGYRITVNLFGIGDDEELIYSTFQSIENVDVVRHGWVDDFTVHKDTFDLVLMPSYYEGFPLVFIECVFHGIPILVSDIVCFKRCRYDSIRVDFSIKEHVVEKLVKIGDFNYGEFYRDELKILMKNNSLSSSRQKFIDFTAL